MSLTAALTAAGISTAGNLIGGHISNSANKHAQYDQNIWNAGRDDIAWKRQMEASNTAYQRAFEDMKKAGLNPNLAATSGGASTPSAASTGGSTTPRADFSNIGNNASSALTSTYGLEAQTANINANTAKTMAETKYVEPSKKAEIANIQADTIKKNAETENARATNEQIKEQVKQLKIDNISRDDMNRIEIAFKKSQNEDVQQKVIAQAIENAYHEETGTALGMTIAEKIASLVYSEIKSQVKDKKPINPVGAIKNVIYRLNHQ